MSLWKCPDCREFHRGNCMVCRPCARRRLTVYAASLTVSRETSEEELRKAFVLLPWARRFVEPREPGRVPVDPDAEQLAAEVVDCIVGMDAA